MPRHLRILKQKHNLTWQKLRHFNVYIRYKEIRESDILKEKLDLSNYTCAHVHTHTHTHAHAHVPTYTHVCTHTCAPCGIFIHCPVATLFSLVPHHLPRQHKVKFNFFYSFKFKININKFIRNQKNSKKIPKNYKIHNLQNTNPN